MKVILLSDFTDPPVPLLLADSAVARQGYPFFVPDENGEYVAAPAVIFTITRLGKSIAERFAGRYHDEGMLAVSFRSAKVFDKELAPPEFYSFDGAVAPGAKLKEGELKWRLDKEIFTLDSTDNVIKKLHRLISDYSRLNTLKMGDKFILPVGKFSMPLRPDMLITVEHEGKELMKVKIK